MGKKIKYKGKIIIATIGTSIIIYSAIFSIIFFRFKNETYSSATNVVDMTADNYASMIINELQIEIGKVRAMAYGFLGYKNIEVSKRFDFFQDQLNEISRKTPMSISVSTAFELNTYGNDPGDIGRVILMAYKKNNKIIENRVHRTGHETGLAVDNYNKIRQHKQETIDEPYLFSLTYDGKNEILITSICVPIIENNKFVGLSAIDISLDRFQEFTDEINPYKNTYAIMLSNKGKIIAGPEEENINLQYDDIEPDFVGKYDIMRKIENGEKFSALKIDKDGKKHYASLSPITIGNTTTPWSLLVVTPTDEAFEEANKTLKILLLIGLIGLLVLTSIIYAISNSLVTILNKVIKFSTEISEGNLNTEISIDRQDELGQIAVSMRGMRDSLRAMVNSLKESSEHLFSVANQMESSSQKLADDANLQASNTEELAASMEEVSSIIKQNSGDSKETEHIAENTSQIINKGNKATQETAQIMKQIEDKIEVITEIAFQTNVLALNAAVEATRAGSEGKGFRVIALEVRKLAEKSKIAAEQINQSITLGVETANHAGDILSDTLPEIKKTVQLVSNISVGSQEQANGSEQINTAIMDINRITKENAQSSEKIANNAKILKKQAEQLAESINLFQT